MGAWAMARSYWGGYSRRTRGASPTTASLTKRLGRAPAPVHGEGRKLAKTFWGRAWCQNLERYHDFKTSHARASIVHSSETGSALFHETSVAEPFTLVAMPRGFLATISR